MSSNITIPSIHNWNNEVVPPLNVTSPTRRRTSPLRSNRSDGESRSSGVLKLKNEKLEEAQIEIVNLKEEVTKITSLYNDAKIKLKLYEEREERFNQVNEKLTNSELDNDELKKELNKSKAKIEDLTLKKHENEEIEIELNRLSTENKEKDEIIENLKEELEDALDICEEDSGCAKVKDIDRLEKALKEKTDEANDIKEKYGRLQYEHDELKSKHKTVLNRRSIRGPDV